MHDLLNNILTIISLVVHTIVQLFNRKRGHHEIAVHDNEKNFLHSSNKIERTGDTDEKKSTIK